jgi:hypothetical protein
MKTKIIGIIICLMLMTTFLTHAENIESITVKDESTVNAPISNYDVEPPDWELGCKWCYKINKFIIDFKDPDISLYADIKFDDFCLEVTSITEEYYELTFDSLCNGTFWIYFDLGNGIINISTKLQNINFDGTIILNKTTMGIKELHPTISGFFDVEIIDQPYIEFPFKLHREEEVTIDLDIVFDDAHRPIVKFPFNIFDCWGLPAGNLTLDGTISSPILEKIYDFNDIINPFLSIIAKIFPKFSRLLELSDILLDILPEIHICYILTEYLGREDCVFNIPEVPEYPPIICCLGKDIITVPAGTFDCYNITIAEMANLYYNTTIGAIVKFVGNLQDIIPSISNIEMELIEYYCPTC